MLNLAEFSDNLKNNLQFSNEIEELLFSSKAQESNPSLKTMATPDEFSRVKAKTLAIDAALRIIQKAKITT